MADKLTIYAMYKGEEVLAIGTAPEIAEKMGIKVETVHYYATPAHRRKAKKEHSNSRMVFRLEDEE
jgi:hypothetical protein